MDFIFTQPIYHNFVEIDCEKIKKYCYDIRSDSSNTDNRLLSNYGGWQSIDLFDESIFYHHIVPHVKRYFEILQIQHLKFSFISFWINISGKDNFNTPHTHPCSFFSGVLYVQAPKNSGNLVFVDSNKNIRTSYEQHYGLAEELPLNNIFSKEWNFVPKNNLLVLFPSWIEHYVKPNCSDEDRISIAFDIGVSV